MDKKKYKIAQNILVFGALLSSAIGTYFIVEKMRNKLEAKSINAQIKQNIKINNIFKEAKSRLEKGDIEKIAESIQKLPKDKLNRAQIFDIYAILAQIKIEKFQKTANIKLQNKLYSEANFFLKEANDYVDKQSIQNALLYYYGKLEFAAKKYQKALNNFDSIGNTNRLSKLEKDKLNLYIGDCYKGIKNYNKALKAYKSIMNDNANSYRLEAKNRAAKIYSLAVDNPQILTNTKSLSKKEIKELKDKYYKNGLELFTQILADKNVSMNEFANAKVGRFIINLGKLSSPKIYSNVNSILNSTFSSNYKVEALFALSNYEEKNGNIQQSINILHGALSNYRKLASARGAYLKLYNYYKNMGDWNGAFSMAKELLNDRNNFKTLVILTNDFASDSNPLFAMLEHDKKVHQYIKTLEDIIEVYKTQMPEEWQQIKFQTNFIIAQTAYRIQDYKLAQKYLNEFYKEKFPNKKTAEKVLFLDIHTALKLNQPPAVIISRCLRYFSNVNKGSNYKEVMAILLDNYYISGLYSEAINIAKKIYLDELKQLTSQNKQKIKNSDKNWLRTVAKIGQCYAKKGDYYKSNLIIKQYSLDFLNKSYASDIYIDWAKVSSALQQYLEARRRYDIAWLKAKNSNEKLVIDIQRLLLDFKYRRFLENFYNDANDLIEKINSNNNNFTTIEKKHHCRSLYEAILELALEHRDSETYSRTLERIMNLYANDYWPGYWALRDIINSNGENDVNVILKNSQLYIKNIPQKSELQKKYLQMVKDQVDIIKNLNKTKNDVANIKKELGL